MPSSPPSPLLDAFEHQDKIFSSAFSILRDAIAQRKIPSASVAVTDRGRLVALKALGRFTPQADSPVVTTSTLFDLASLTKVVATSPMAMILYDRGLLDLEAPVTAIIPEFTSDAERDRRRKQVTLRMLLAHSSGLPAYEKLFLKFRTRDELLHAAFTTPLTADPATHAEYSDIGFIILGIALERLADEPLDRFCQREIFAALGMTNTTFNPPKEIRSKIPPTADERQEEVRAVAVSDRKLREQHAPTGTGQNPSSTFRGRIIQGEVQDENASVLGGVAAHAGLFSSAPDLARFAHAILTGGYAIFRPETVALFTRRESAPVATSRALGWDTPSAPSQSGKYFSPQSYGHLGYTGTSLWIDPVSQISITLLTNRTWPDCSNHAIKIIRPAFHDAVVEAIKKSQANS
ncbi:MAG: beta-lactamase [Candidatus Sulfotelmatobacter sp.]|nr:beta-lactamase [Candidatus Sulfotelmatobacter sp.]